MAAITFFCSLACVLLLLPRFSQQLAAPQYKALVRIKQQLNFPRELTAWSENADFCNSQPSEVLTLACYEDDVTQLHLSGNQVFPHLDQDFSANDLFSNIADLPNLKVLSLVSLGLTGPLPSKIGDLHSLEILNISSNYFNGSIPREISYLKSLQTLILDHNSFTGEVPEWLSSLTGLSVLSLRNNSLSGSVPNALSNMVNLRVLVMSANNLSGPVYGIKKLENLQVLDLEDNQFGPQFPSLPKKLVSLILRKNNFHSSAESDAFSSCYQLQKLDISMNELVGQFPSSLFSLPLLTYLDIGGNKFTGKIQQNITCYSQLVFVNMSENRITGDLPKCLRSSSRKRVVLYHGNCFSSRYPKQHPLSYCHTEALAVKVSSPKQGENGKLVVASTMAGGFAGAAALAGIAFVLVRREFGKQRKGHTTTLVEKVSPVYTSFQLLKDARYISETMKMGIPAYKTFGMEELREATDNFSPRNLVGEGSLVRVYKGQLDGMVVAIGHLKLKANGTKGVHFYTNQLELVAKLRHHHLVTSLGHCFEWSHDGSRATSIYVVFEYMENGTLRDFIISEGEKLSWGQRISAAMGVARGIQFLHTGIVPGIFSNRIKITDIVLDHDLSVKISKYNIPLLMNKTSDEMVKLSHGSNMEMVQGKDDVYDFGVILLELIVGRMLISSDDIQLHKQIVERSLRMNESSIREVADECILEECTDDSLRTLLALCINCLSEEAFNRPSIEDVLWNLQFATQVQDSWNPNSSSTRSSPKPEEK